MLINSYVYRLTFLGIILISSTAYVNSNPDPTKKRTHSLFKIERSKDTDEVFYDINLDPRGKIDLRNPIRIYWRKNTLGGIEENLSWVQQKFGYGLKYFTVNDSEIIFRFVSYINRDFTLKKNCEGNYKVYTSLNNEIIEVKKLFIQFDGGTYLSSRVSKVELHGIGLKTHNQVIEIISP